MKWERLRIQEVRHFDDLLFWSFTTLPAEEMESFIVMRWRLWSERNKEVMNPTASGAVHSDYIWEWDLANKLAFFILAQSSWLLLCPMSATRQSNDVAHKPAKWALLRQHSEI
ncbi:unnamed protein product [Citrullus colocynthis]|uniref:Uncharacterized protein n=1 Tax=Citrullus colocynthis TaxID=252529 RepID=A0ABP0ZB26_9ROSI